MHTLYRILMPAGIASMLFLSGGIIAHAQTGTTSTTGTTTASTTVPGTPNTGAGASAPMNLALLGVSALMAIGGVGYLARSGATPVR